MRLFGRKKEEAETPVETPEGPVVAPEAVGEMAEVEEVMAAEPAKRRANWGGRVAWVLAMAAIGAVVGLAIVAYLKFIDGPVSDRPDITLAGVQASTSPTPTVSELAGIYVDLTYPGVFDQVAQVKNDANALEQYNIGSKADYRRAIAVSVRKLPTGIVNDDASYRLRKINPQDYKERVDLSLGEPVQIMTKSDKTEQTLFWAHKNMVLTVAVTSTNPKDDLGAYMELLKSKLRWRQ